MTRYLDTDNDSSVASYYLYGNAIGIRFKDNSRVFYYRKNRTMERLAKKGDGLNAYINVYKPAYSFSKPRVTKAERQAKAAERRAKRRKPKRRRKS